MGFFSKNSNKDTVSGVRKNFTDVIKNSGGGNLLIWRQPEEDFNTNSTLIVMPGEEAIFIKGGTIEQVFENGTYKLSTENYPFISRLRNAFSGGVSTFNCVVYFVRKAHSAEILWGTDSPIQVRDKLLGIATKLKARGSYKVQVKNPAKFLEKLIGNNINIQTQAGLNKYFFNEFQSKIKSVIARAINETNAELLGIDARLDEFSESIEPFMQDILEDYGLRCVKFVVSAVDIEDNELRRKYDEIGMEAIEKLRMAQANKGAIDVLGDDWARLEGFGILKDLANNPGAGGAASVGAGLGMGMGAVGMFGAVAQQAFAPTQNSFSAQPSSASEDPIETLSKLKKMLELGLIEQTEYDAKKSEILSKM